MKQFKKITIVFILFIIILCINMIKVDAKTYQPNTQTYDTPEGPHTIYWAVGVDAPLMTSDPAKLGTKGYFDFESLNGYNTFSAEFEPNKGYFDYNKNLQDRPDEKPLCYLGSAANLISWWLEQNKPYVDEYINRLKTKDIYGQYEGLVQVIPFNEKMWNEIIAKPGEEVQNGFRAQKIGKSPLITKWLKPYYYKKDDGFYTDLVLDFFFNGYDAIPIYTDMPQENTPENFKKDPRGGFFFPLFGRERIVQRLYGSNYNTFDYLNNNLKRFFNEGKGIMFGYNVNALEGHAITVWGAEYDQNNKLCRIYITDTDDFQESKAGDAYWRGLVGFNVVADKNGKACITNNSIINPDKPGNYIQHITLLDLAQNKLEAQLADITPPAEAIINSQSEDKVYALGAQVNVKVDATTTDKGYLEYDWYVSDNPTDLGNVIPNQNKSSVKIDTSTVQVKYYTCLVKNIKNGKTSIKKSKPIKVDVQDIQLVNAETPKVNFDYSTVNYDQFSAPVTPLVKVEASVSDVGKLTYQWYQARDSYAQNGTKLEGETNPVFYPPTNDATDRLYYYCVITNTNENVNGNTVATYTVPFSKRIVINAKPLVEAQEPLIIKQPTELHINKGDAGAQLSVEAKIFDGGNLTYQWYEVAEDSTAKIIPNQTSNVFKLETNKPGTKKYKCEVKNTNDKATNVKEKSAFSNEVVVEVIGEVNPSSNCALKELNLKNGVLKPGFDKNNSNYKVELDHQFSFLDFEAIPEDPNATVNIQNPVVNIGDRVNVLITVVAEDKIAYKQYKIQVSRDGTHTFGKWEKFKEPTCSEAGKEKRVCSACGKMEIRDIEALGHRWELTWTIDREPTCILEGEKSYHCKVCEERKDITMIKKINHKFGDWQVVKEPTCTEKGQEKRICQMCKQVELRDVVPIAHNYEKTWTIDKQATCTKDGEKSHHCTMCGDRKDITIIPKTDHSWEKDWTIDIKPTCLNEGEMSHHCTWCSERRDITKMEKAAHQFGDWEVVTKATCTKPGLEKRKCTVCGIEETREIPIADHEWNPDFTIDKVATCKDQGEKSIHCKNCDAKKDVTPIPVTNEHVFGDWQITEKPTCTKAGTEKRKCAVCGKEETREVPKAPHEWNKDFTIDKAATCKDQGEKSIHCKNCSERKDIQVIEKTNNHKFGDWEIIKDATCTESGQRKHKCTICGKEETETIKAKGHDWNKDFTVDKEANCQEQGEKSIHCKNCNERKDIQVIDKADHKFGEWENIKNATCTEDGQRKHKCTICGQEVTETVKAKGHEWNKDFTIDKEATCGEQGEKSIHCKNCNERKNVTSIAKNNNHKFGDWEVIKDATCTEDGQRKHKCTICGKEETEAIKAKGHDWNEDFTIDKEATCGEQGEKSIHCKNCDERKEITEIEKNDNHKFGDWEVVKDATCTKDGQRKHKCTICGKEETETIKAKGHDWNKEFTIDKEATEKEQGEKSIHCKRCQERKDVTKIAIKQASKDKLNNQKHVHKWEEDYTIDKEATCTQSGIKSIHCKTCKETKDITEVDPLGHEFGDWKVVKKVSETEDGLKERTCLRCGEKEGQKIPKLNSKFMNNDNIDDDKKDEKSEGKSNNIVVISIIVIIAATVVGYVYIKNKRN